MDKKNYSARKKVEENERTNERMKEKIIINYDFLNK